MRRRFSPAAAQPVQHLGQPARLVVEPDQQAGGVVPGRARRLPPEQQEARDVDGAVVEARLRHDQVEQLGGQRGRQRGAACRSSRAIAAAAAADGAATRAAPAHRLDQARRAARRRDRVGEHAFDARPSSRCGSAARAPPR